jgi:hypothetical protein
MTVWELPLVDSVKVKGKPPNWMPGAAVLIKLGVPLKVARRWEKERYDITTGLKRRLWASRN